MKQKLGLALGSGADRGAAHIGIIKVLLQETIDINCITGASIGSIVAAYYALNGSIAGLETLIASFSRRDYVGLIDLNIPTISLIKGNNARTFLRERIFGNATFEDCKIPCAIVATNIQDGTPYVFTSGDIVSAIIASSTIPGVLPPVEKDGFHLVDGGLAEAVPLKELDVLGADLRIGVDLYAFTSNTAMNFGAHDVLSRAYRLYLSKLSALTPQMNDTRTLILRPKTDEGIETMTFSKMAENIRAGEEETREHLPEIRTLLSRE
jgi:NTE family protein